MEQKSSEFSRESILEWDWQPPHMLGGNACCFIQYTLFSNYYVPSTVLGTM